MRNYVLLSLAIFACVLGLLLLWLPNLMEGPIQDIVELTNEEIKAIWSAPPIDIKTSFWLYGISNKENFINGSRPKITRHGPYVFGSRPVKKIIAYSDNKFRVTYNSTRYYHLMDRISPSMDEQLNLLNPVYASVATALSAYGHKQTNLQASSNGSSGSSQQQLDMMYGAANRLMDKFNETLIRVTTPREALIGRKIMLLEKVRKMAEAFEMKLDMPDPPPNDTLGYVFSLNATWQGPFEIWTGYKSSRTSLGDIVTWEGKKRLPWYPDKCGRLQTSAGELRPMPIKDKQRLEIFIPSLCRIIQLDPVGKRKRREGEVIKYIVSPESFANRTVNPENSCFCTKVNPKDDHCSLNGAIEAAPCYLEVPMIITVSGIEMDSRIVGTLDNWDSMYPYGLTECSPLPIASFMEVLTRFGVAIQADLTITIFVRIEQDTKFKQTTGVPEVTYVPVVTMREQIEIPQILADKVIVVEDIFYYLQQLNTPVFFVAFCLLVTLIVQMTRTEYGSSMVHPESSTTLDNQSSLGDITDSCRSQPPSGTSGRSLDVGSDVNLTPATNNNRLQFANNNSKQQQQLSSAAINNKLNSNMSRKSTDISDISPVTMSSSLSGLTIGSRSQLISGGGRRSSAALALNTNNASNDDQYDDDMGLMRHQSIVSNGTTRRFSVAKRLTSQNSLAPASNNNEQQQSVSTITNQQQEQQQDSGQQKRARFFSKLDDHYEKQQQQQQADKDGDEGSMKNNNNNNEVEEIGKERQRKQKNPMTTIEMGEDKEGDGGDYGETNDEIMTATVDGDNDDVHVDDVSDDDVDKEHADEQTNNNNDNDPMKLTKKRKNWLLRLYTNIVHTLIFRQGDRQNHHLNTNRTDDNNVKNGAATNNNDADGADNANQDANYANSNKLTNNDNKQQQENEEEDRILAISKRIDNWCATALEQQQQLESRRASLLKNPPTGTKNGSDNSDNDGKPKSPKSPAANATNGNDTADSNSKLVQQVIKEESLSINDADTGLGSSVGAITVDNNEKQQAINAADADEKNSNSTNADNGPTSDENDQLETGSNDDTIKGLTEMPDEEPKKNATDSQATAAAVSGNATSNHELNFDATDATMPPRSDTYNADDTDGGAPMRQLGQEAVSQMSAADHIEHNGGPITDQAITGDSGQNDSNDNENNDKSAPIEDATTGGSSSNTSLNTAETGNGSAKSFDTVISRQLIEEDDKQQVADSTNESDSIEDRGRGGVEPVDQYSDEQIRQEPSEETAESASAKKNGSNKKKKPLINSKRMVSVSTSTDEQQLQQQKQQQQQHVDTPELDMKGTENIIFEEQE